MAMWLGAKITDVIISKTDLLCNLNRFIVPFVFKAIFAFNGKQDVRYHNYGDKYKTVYIKPIHKYAR